MDCWIGGSGPYCSMVSHFQHESGSNSDLVDGDFDNYFGQTMDEEIEEGGENDDNTTQLIAFAEAFVYALSISIPGYIFEQAGPNNMEETSVETWMCIVMWLRFDDRQVWAS
ncbi:hypothetical protein OCU04_011926 [Sclerotinia nivalis]|uniref:Uncharacterized protein n=1 Tax=Sclerotinia nivalis TaxID=352851 RepID=A0A9X0AA10_9HELO|nr:hypothetical protein OCU04_011926 [Sclerotinia nivalis]